MIAVYILAGLLILILLILLLPVGVYLKYDGDFAFKVKFAGIKVYELKEKKQKADTKEKPVKTEKVKENRLKTSFEKLKDKHGFVGAIKEIFGFFRSCINHLGYLLKTMKFKRVCMDLSVAGEDAAATAIRYGQVCSVVYPVLSFFQSKTNVKYKQINIKSEFEKANSSFSFSMIINLQIIFLIIAGIRVLKEYKNFSVRNGL